ncbi:hypothetical protein VWJ57_04210 [Escherichia coli O157]|uniref:hypothetical protein n=1 Tax=Escherichia coli TaxID=562 RepID=UPI0010B26305|nr:hypothetical protein [Escherichia coli]MED6536527.1 hypothetical protein [Escherichia coli O157]MDI0694660.1 hypothetical protein [Escherichia coli]MED6561986.1 hypothetical protein [Escherichia coli O157]MED6826669.1 hypothetical protein [Escherichia coli O157]MED6970923.1 hypothetical protein [Escherichia coli O157]
MNAVQNIMAQIMNDPVPAIGTWSRHNCPACVFRGHSRPDTKHRGNHMFNADGSVSYNCFNCSLKTGWQPGKYMSKDMESLLISFGAQDKEIELVKFYIKEMVDSGDFAAQETVASKLYDRVTVRDLPSNAKTFWEWASLPEDKIPQEFISVLHNVNERNPYLLDLELYWSPNKEHKMYDRFIIPYFMNGKIIGYTARHKLKDPGSTYRFINQVSTNILYNYDLLKDERIKTILVCEGPLDAALMGGVSANNFKLSNVQIDVLKDAQQKGKKIVIVPDRDKDGLITIDQALENGFSVSFPDFGAVREGSTIRHIKDFEEACARFGRLFCLQLIHDSIVDEPFYIKAQTDKWM